MSHFFELAEVLARWPNRCPSGGPYPVGCEERLRRALEQRLAPGVAAPVGRGDLAGLVRDVLLAQRWRGGMPSLSVPTAAEWPDADLWQAHGVRVTIATADRFHLEAGEADDWRPRWLSGDDLATPLRYAFDLSPRRIPPSDPATLAIDPCLRDALNLPFEAYQSQGQQQAIGSAFNVAPSTAVLILLPTGAGKSLAAWAPALLGSHSGRVSLVVTPTIALAIDQEKQVQQLTGRREPMAYHSALADDARARIKQGIRAGFQRIVFASPESIMGSLSHAIYEAAGRGYLANFVIDEAHLVAEWGDEFRPEFQAVAGVRRDLLSRCPRDKQFRTLLMTATLTAEGYHTLLALFGTPGGMEVVSAVHLRAEPSYWVYHAADRAEQERRVLEAVRCAPRPFLLYTTRPKDAEFWHGELRRYGIHRIGLIHGGTVDRQRVIEDWRDGAIDGVVATSAFGLGMDKRDVRTVIHACVPETVDRFYQEVGRGGRDPETHEIDLADERPHAKAQRAERLSRLPAIARQLVLKPENNARFWEQTENRAADFTRAAAWALSLSPFEFEGSYRAAELGAAAQLGQAEVLFSNSTRWNGFTSWAVFTGFASYCRHKPDVVIDPTPAVRDALADCARAGEDIPIDAMLERLAQAVPVLDGERYRRELEGRLIEGTWRPPGQHQISQSLSLAFSRLQEAGAVRLDARADAPQRELLGRGNRTLRRVSHVVYLAGN